jgi:hypothetical protein
MENLERALLKLKSIANGLFFPNGIPKDRIITDVNEFLRYLSRETSKCIRENGRVLLISFRVPYLSEERREEFEQELANSFRFYDLIAKLSEDVYSVAVVSMKPPNEGINVHTVISRIKDVLRKNGLSANNLNYSFKVIPYDGVNLEALLKVSLRELQGTFELPLSLSPKATV